jgi:hypothetical protein
MSRAKGTPNKVTREVRDVLKDIVNGELEGLPKRLAKLPDVDRVTVLMKLLAFIVPKPMPKQEAESSTDWTEFAEALANTLRYNS